VSVGSRAAGLIGRVVARSLVALAADRSRIVRSSAAADNSDRRRLPALG